MANSKYDDEDAEATRRQVAVAVNAIATVFAAI